MVDIFHVGTGTFSFSRHPRSLLGFRIYRTIRFVNPNLHLGLFAVINGSDFITIHFSLQTPYITQAHSLSLVTFPFCLGRVIAVRRSMAEHAGEPESLIEKIADKIHGHDSSSSSDSDDDKRSKVEEVQAKIFRLFGREKPIHKVLGGGKPADVFLWRNKKLSAGVLGGATILWVLFELLEYHLITLVCHILILSLALLFLWSNASTFINKSPPQIPEVRIPEKIVLEVVSALRAEVNYALAVLRNIASGKDLKKFLGVIAGLWVLSVFGNWCNFLTLFYIAFVVLHTVPVLYEKYEDQVDALSERATIEIKKQYVVFDSKVLSKIPKGPLKEKKKD